MAFFQSASGSLQTIVIALGAGFGVWGALGYTILLCFSLFKTSAVTKTIFQVY